MQKQTQNYKELDNIYTNTLGYLKRKSDICIIH